MLVMISQSLGSLLFFSYSSIEVGLDCFICSKITTFDQFIII